jgi:transposase-like protein
VDETYVKVAGTWRYLFRAIDQFGQVIDVFLSPGRDASAARRFFAQAIDRTRISPIEVTTDRHRVHPRVLIPAGGLLRLQMWASPNRRVDSRPWGRRSRWRALSEPAVYAD